VRVNVCVCVCVGGGGGVHTLFRYKHVGGEREGTDLAN
jgi:hypothetical protein